MRNNKHPRGRRNSRRGRTSALLAVFSALTLLPHAHPPQAAHSASEGAPCGAAANLTLLAAETANIRTAPSIPAPPPDIPAAAWVVADARSGTIFAGKNTQMRLKPASTLKTLTLLTLLTTGEPLTSSHIATEGNAQAEGSSAGLVAGKPYTLEDLAHGLVLVSGNDAAEAIAGAAGGRETFVGRMNVRARLVNATNTWVANPSGLDDPGQCTTVEDIAQIFRAGMRDTSFQDIFSQKEYAFPAEGREPGGGAGNTETITSQNKLLLHDYPGIKGGKTGFTDESGRTFVAQAEQNGHELVIAVFGFSSDTEEIATRLFDWGFAHTTGVHSGAGTLPLPYWSPLLGLFPAAGR